MATRPRNGSPAQGAQAGSDHAQAVEGTAQSITLSRLGVRTGEDFANLMSALMADVLDGTINVNAANAAVNAGGKLLKVVEMQYRYGQTAREGSLVLAPGRTS